MTIGGKPKDNLNSTLGKIVVLSSSHNFEKSNVSVNDRKKVTEA